MIVLLTASSGSAFIMDEDGVDYIDNGQCYNVHFSVLPVKEQIFMQLYDGEFDQVRLMDVKRISGQAILQDGSVQEVTFRPTKTINHKHISRRGASVYVAHGEWIKEHNNFTLQVRVPLKQQAQNLVMNSDQNTKLVGLNFCIQ
ncbi:MAG TPA: hypothetical protein VJL89_10950 [Thermodesulfovibrionia bacterium]|nr:hypothetical protein [Thermodesulfovibrionia bacterium]